MDDLIEVHSSKRLTKNEIAISDYDKASAIAKMLVDEGYCVMLSTEEDLYIVNYTEWISDEYPPRNRVYFNNVEELEGY